MQTSSPAVVPNDSSEVTVMVVWPSVARYSLGRFLGELYANRAGFYIFTLGNMIALASIPLALAMYFLRAAQGVSYKLTNRRIAEMRFGDVRKSVSLDAFDQIRVEQSAGQAWYAAGDLVFLQADREVFRLESVCCPESFRQTCVKTQTSHIAVRQVLDRQAAVA